MKLPFLPAACHFECDHFLLNHIAVWSLECLCKLPHVANFKLLENWMSCEHLKAPPNYLTCIAYTCIRTNILIKRVSFSSLQIYTTCIFGTLTFYLVGEEKKTPTRTAKAIKKKKKLVIECMAQADSRKLVHIFRNICIFHESIWKRKLY